MASNDAKVVSTNSSGATLVGSKRKRQGRRKIPIEYIQNKAAPQVCFSKRRQGLFKKAFQLSVLCGANIAVNVTSSSGRPYSFMHPSNTPSVLDGCISSPQVLGQTSQPDSLPDVTQRVSELNAKEETRNKEIDRLHESNKAKVVSSNSGGATLVGSKRKWQGRRKIPIERIENEGAHQVCFRKRREGLFKKALELAVVCGANVGVIANSPAGRPYTFIHPSNTPSVLNRYISSPQVPGHASQTDSLTRQMSELSAAIATAKAKKETLKRMIDELHADVDNLSLEELLVVRTRLLQIKSDLKASAEMTTHDSSSISVPNMGTSSNES